MQVRKAVFPVAGLGTRFLPATKSSPKEMLPLIDKPLVHYVVEEAVAAGIEHILFVTGRGKRALEDYFDISFELEALLQEKGKDKAFKEIRDIADMVKIYYVRQKQALGLGHAILCAREFVGDEPFAVLLVMTSSMRRNLVSPSCSMFTGNTGERSWPWSRSPWKTSPRMAA